MQSEEVRSIPSATQIGLHRAYDPYDSSGLYPASPRYPVGDEKGNESPKERSSRHRTSNCTLPVLSIDIEIIGVGFRPQNTTHRRYIEAKEGAT